MVDARTSCGWQAATALVLTPDDRDPRAAAVAVIERAQRVGDRWSGHMALPGGRREPDDADLAATAAREAFEEVGLDLGHAVARLSDQRRRSGGVVATYVFVLGHRPELRPEPAEVADAWWLPLWTLTDPSRRVPAPAGPGRGIADRGRVIWGMTERILADLASTVALTPAPGSPAHR